MTAKSILIVDDNPANLKLMRILLTSEGYITRTATDATEAMNVLATLQPQLILMDIQLPGVSGLELTKQLKADPKYKDIIILALTAYAMKGDEEKALRAGCNGYLAKPIDIKTLPGIIAKYLQQA